MNRQFLRERFPRAGDVPPVRSVMRISVIRVWMSLPAAAVLAASVTRVVAGS